MTMKTIEDLARDYAERRNSLADHVNAYTAELETLNQRLLPGIKRAVASADKARERLQALVADHPELFVKPKSVTFHGIRVGFKKGVGSIQWDDAAKVVSLIRKHFPEQADVLVKITEAPVKNALAQLPAADLKKLGITVEETGDEAFIKPVAGDVEKFVAALLRGAEVERLEKAA